MNIECLSGNEYGGFENIFNGAEMIREPRVWYESKKNFLVFDNVVDVKSHNMSTDIDDFSIQEIAIETEKSLKQRKIRRPPEKGTTTAPPCAGAIALFI